MCVALSACLGRDSLLRRICQQICLLFFAVLPLGACSSGGGLSKLTIDDSIETSALQERVEQNPVQNSDANIVRNAVSAVDLNASAGAPLSWANQDTGSSGTISEIRESNDNGLLCRNFKTSRASFEGVAMYSGSTCLDTEKQWFVRNFVAL
jgi:17 kDa outer membrane surface antigen